MSRLAFFARLAAPIALAAALAAPSAQADSKVGTVHIKYDLNLSGVPIAEMSIDMTLKDASYNVSGNGRTVGLVDMFSKIRFFGQSRGAIKDGDVIPNSHSYTYSERGKTREVALKFDSTRIPKITAKPPFGKSSDRIPLPLKKLAGAIDVASQFIMPVVAGRSTLEVDNCIRSYGVSDGRVRVDAVVRPVKSVKLDILRGTSYKGPFLQCALTVHPIGGHKVGGMLSKLEGDGVISVWVAPTLGGRYFVPIKVSVPTSFGTAELVVRKITAVPAARQAGLGG